MALLCYHGTIPYKINQDRANEIFKAMLDITNRKIIICIKNESKTTLQISTETGLSKSMTYRRLRELDKKKLIILSGEINANGKKIIKYKSKIRKIITTFADPIADVKIYSNLTY